MKLTRNTMFLAIFSLGLVPLFSVMFNINFLELRSVSTFLFLSTTPGVLFLLLLRVRGVDFAEYLSYAVGLSILIMMSFGFILNYSLPYFGIPNPLSPFPMYICFSILIITLGLIAYLRNKDLLISITSKTPSWSTLAGIVVPLCFPILATLGAVSLNNGGSNVFTMLMLSGIAMYVFLLTLFRKRVKTIVYITSLFFISLSLLLMVSLRGWYITGHDIQTEYYVFQLTKNMQRWDITLFQDSYNACLSLNILPTIYYVFTGISDIYIFKVLFQILFSAVSVILFLLYKRHLGKFIAFLAVFCFVSFPTYITDMAMLNRQEIAFLFLSLMFLSGSNKKLSSLTRDLLFTLFGFGMIVSHYSTSYIAVAIFFATYFALLISRHFIKTKTNLSFINIALVSVFLIIWNFKITGTASGITKFISTNWQYIRQVPNTILPNKKLDFNLGTFKRESDEVLLSEFISSEAQKDLSEGNTSLYPKEVVNAYPIVLALEDTLPLTRVGKYINSHYFNVFNLNKSLRDISSKLFLIFIMVGSVIMVFRRTKLFTKVQLDSKIYVAVSISLLFCAYVLPRFTAEYGIQRFFQQTLIILAVPIIVGSVAIFGTLISALIFLTIFLSISGYIPQIFGGYYPQLNLNNAGTYYKSDYTSNSEIMSTSWLKTYSIPGNYIQSSDAARFKIRTQTGLYSSGRLLPGSIDQGSYIFLDQTNSKDKVNRVYFKGRSLYYKYPVDFLDNNKDLIYNNSNERIYK